jgi:hypothetical protein
MQDLLTEAEERDISWTSCSIPGYARAGEHRLAMAKTCRKRTAAGGVAEMEGGEKAHSSRGASHHCDDASPQELQTTQDRRELLL